MNFGHFVIGVIENADNSLYSWQAVAVALINMVGAVIMAFFRERTNMAKEERFWMTRGPGDAFSSVSNAGGRRSTIHKGADRNPGEAAM